MGSPHPRQHNTLPPQHVVFLALFVIVIQIPSIKTVKLHLTESNPSPCIYHKATGSLYCNKRSLTEVPSVERSMAIQLFNLDDNQITAVNKDDFVNCSDTVTQISINQQSTNIDRIDDNAFANLNKLFYLKITSKAANQNSMSEVNLKTVISTLSALVTLEMQNINLGNLNANLFTNNPKLRDITFLSCKMVDINREVFSNANNVELLNISFTTLPGTDLAWLKALPKLNKLVLDNNALTHQKFDQIASSFINLKSISLQGNDIKEIGTSMFANVADTLETLDLASNNQLSQTLGLERLKNLKKLTMHSISQLTKIPNEIRSLEKLEFLDMSLTGISILEGNSFHQNSAMKTLHLEEVPLVTLHINAFKSMQHLTDLRIGNGHPPSSIHNLNSVTIVGAETGNWSAILEYIPKLTNLVLRGSVSSNGGLTDSIWKSIKLCPKLQNIDLTYNKIQTIKDFELGSNWPSLSKINLKGNEISQISSATFYNCGSPRNVAVNLESNKIATIDNCTLALYDTIEPYVSLADNPLVCDCKLLWLFKKLQSSPNLVNMKCASPPSLAGKTWNTISDSSMCSGTPTFTPCQIIIPTTPPIINRYPVDINIERVNNSAIAITLGGLNPLHQEGPLTYKIEYREMRNTSDTKVTKLQIATQSNRVEIDEIQPQENYQYCVIIYNRTGHENKHPGNCKNFELIPKGVNVAALTGGLLGAILLVFIVIVVIILYLKRRNSQMKKSNTATMDGRFEEDPYTYEYVDDREVKYNKNQPQLRPQSKRYTKKNMTGSRPSLANSTTTLSTTVGSPHSGIGFQNGSRPHSGPSHMDLQQQQMAHQSLHGSMGHLSGGGQPASMGFNQHRYLSQSTDQLSHNNPAHRQLPQAPRHHSQEVLLDVMKVGNGNPPVPPRQPSGIMYNAQQPPQVAYDNNYTDMAYQGEQHNNYNENLYYPPRGTIVSKEEEMRARGYVPMQDAAQLNTSSSTDPPQYPTSVSQIEAGISNRQGTPPHTTRSSRSSRNGSVTSSNIGNENRGYDRGNSTMSLKFESHF